MSLDCREETPVSKDVWKYALMELGGQCVMMDGMQQMLELSAGSLDFQIVGQDMMTS